MPTCEKCDHKWTWKQTFKKTATIDPAMNCPYCGEKQYQTNKSRMKIAFLQTIILMPLLIQAFFDISGVILVSLLPILFVIIMILYPFLVEISSKEEYIGM